jgi:hypothetical protein
MSDNTPVNPPPPSGPPPIGPGAPPPDGSGPPQPAIVRMPQTCIHCHRNMLVSEDNRVYTVYCSHHPGDVIEIIPETVRYSEKPGK